MHIVSVINYKGGVGKTTLTANLGAELAYRGSKVLLLDLDPQASLTFSFVTPDYWHAKLSKDKTIKKWYDSFNEQISMDLSSIIVRPGKVGPSLGRAGGTLDLIPSLKQIIYPHLVLSTYIAVSIN